jgi:site-specific DNA recombinase
MATTGSTTGSNSLGAVIYTRVSTGEQAEHGTSLDSQRDACRAKALALGLPIIAEYEDAGISGGFLLTRAGMQATLATLKAGMADTLICANLSRYSRDVEHQQAIKKAVRTAGGRLVFCDMDFADTPEGDLAFGIMGNFAEYEKAVIKNRTMRGKRRRAEEGQQPQRSRPPYGYKIVTNAEVAAGLFPPQMRGRYVLDDVKAKIASRIWEEYLENASLTRLARALNAEGVPTPGHGRKWLPSTLRYILTNPAYKGEPMSGRQQCSTDESRLERSHKLTGVRLISPEVRHAAPPEHRLTLSAPSLVSEAQWNTVQELLLRGKQQRGGIPRQVRMLSGQTYCPHCGARAGSKQQRANGKKYLYLACRQFLAAKQSSREPVCVGDVYPVSQVEAATLVALRRAWESPEAIAGALAAYPVEKSETGRQQTDQIAARRSVEDAMAALKSEEASVVQAQIAGIRSGASPDAYADLFTDMAARRKDLLAQLSGLDVALRRSQKPQKSVDSKTETRTADPAAAERIRKALEDAYRVLTSEEVPGAIKRDLLMTIVERVICQKAGADIVFRPGVLGVEMMGINLGTEPSSTCQTTCMGINTQR